MIEMSNKVMEEDEDEDEDEEGEDPYGDPYDDHVTREEDLKGYDRG